MNMIYSEHTSLTLQGKVSISILRKMDIAEVTHSNSRWFFVDFATTEVKLPFDFDTLLLGESKKLIKSNNLGRIKILKAVDQYGHKMNIIPQGYKSICLISFASTIPHEIKSLPTLKQFQYNPKAISLARHNNIQLASRPRNTLHGF